MKTVQTGAAEDGWKREEWRRHTRPA